MRRIRKTGQIVFAVVFVLSIMAVITACGENISWKCPSCGKINQGNYCEKCSHPAPWIESQSNTGSNRRDDFSRIGSTVTFGRYEQDNNTRNGSEDIQWVVLDVRNDSCLLLSKYGLDVKQYNESGTGTTWENCTLRTWLNDYFLRTAFDSAERSAIVLTCLDNHTRAISKWNTVGGSDTWDRVFLLSCAEAQQYLHVDADNIERANSRVVPTSYAKARGAYVSHTYFSVDGQGAGWWWLRSPGRNQNEAARIARGGWRYNNVDVRDACVRPAIWVDLESGAF